MLDMSKFCGGQLEKLQIDSTNPKADLPETQAVAANNIGPEYHADDLDLGL